MNLKLGSSRSNVQFTPDVPVLLLQIAAESKAVDDELIRKAAGLDRDPDEVAEGSGRVPADSDFELSKVS